GPPLKDQDALIQVEDGNLEVVGGQVRSDDFGTANLPRHLLLVRRGDLRVHGCWLQGPVTSQPENYWGLVRVEGTREASPEKVRRCAIHQSVLLSGRMGILVAGAGARVHLEQCLLVAGSDALHFQPGPEAPSRMNTHCSLEHVTVAARRAAIWLEDAGHHL